MPGHGDRLGALLFGSLVGGYLTALVVAAVEGQLLAAVAVGGGLFARVAACRHRRDAD